LAILPLGVLAALGIAVLVLLAILGKVPDLDNSSNGSSSLPPPDIPPVEFVYFDAPRAEAYLGQALGGTENSIERKDKVTRTINATVSAGANAQLGGSEEGQQDTVTTVTPKAADRFYTLMRQLRAKNKEIEYDAQKEECKGGKESEPPWMGDVNEEDPYKTVMQEVRCIRVGNFIRIRRARLLLPSFVRTLPRVRSVGALPKTSPSPHVPFDSPAQSNQVYRALHAYARLVGPNPRIPFVAEPYHRSGERVTFFLPSLYRGVTREPSLLGSSMTIVGLVISASSRGSYTDYQTISTFGHTLLEAQKALRADLGICVKTPKTETRQRSGHRVPCTPPGRMLAEMKRSMKVPPPFVVVLPIAIYDDRRA
jgi:hypothetical protein